MAITFVGSTAFSDAYSGTTTPPYEVPKPAGTTSNDAVIVFISAIKNGGGTTINTLAGFNLITSTVNSDLISNIYIKIAGGSEPSTYDFTTAVTANNVVASAHTYRGTSTSSPVNSFGTINNAGTGVAGSVTVTGAGGLLVVNAIGYNVGSNSSFTAPIGMTGRTPGDTIESGVYTNGGCFDQIVVAGATGTRTTAYFGMVIVAMSSIVLQEPGGSGGGAFVGWGVPR